MIKAMVVEDEYMIRKLIIRVLPWSEMGFSIVDEAESGPEALQKIQLHQPDVVLMDINIPIINGLELTRQVREINPGIHVVIITGYDRFNYAKEAISAGASDYLLKPVNPAELRSSVLRLQRTILEDRQKKNQAETARRKRFLLEKAIFLNQIVKQPYSSEWIGQKFREFGIELPEENLAAMIFQIDRARPEILRDLDLWKYSICNVSNEILSESFKVEVFEGTDGNIVALLHSHMREKEISHSLLEYSIEKIQDSIRFYFGLNLSVAIGNVYDSYSDLFTSYVEALEAIGEKYCENGTSILFYKPNHDFVVPSMFSIFNKEDLLICLRKADRNEVLRKIDDIFQNLITNKAERNYCLFISMGLYAVIEEFSRERNIPFKIIPQKFEYLRQIKNSETIFQAQEYAHALYEFVLGYMEKNCKSETHKIAEKAMDYIDRHYSEELSLEKIASGIFISPCYLSDVFRKETGSTVIEYITGHRLKKAKDLIDSGREISICDLSHKVGYNDSFYFSKCFKKLYGITPSSYQKNKLV